MLGSRLFKVTSWPTVDFTFCLWAKYCLRASGERSCQLFLGLLCWYGPLKRPCTACDCFLAAASWSVSRFPSLDLVFLEISFEGLRSLVWSILDTFADFTKRALSFDRRDVGFLCLKLSYYSKLILIPVFSSVEYLTLWFFANAVFDICSL